MKWVPLGLFKHKLDAADWKRADNYGKAAEKYVGPPRGKAPALRRRHK